VVFCKALAERQGRAAHRMALGSCLRKKRDVFYREDLGVRGCVEGGGIIPVDASDGFVITGDPVEEAIIPHAVLVWTCMNDRPWPEEVYHRWLDQLLAAGSLEAVYLAASLRMT